MLEQVLRELKNYFAVDKRFGVFTVQNGGLELPFLQQGQYFRIIGSVFNDGVYQYPEYNLADESFDGAVWALAIPPAVLSLVDEIEQWQAENGAIVASPYVSESFGGYSYSKKSGNSSDEGVSGWQSAFASRLERWQKL